MIRMKVRHKHDPRHLTILKKIIKEKKIDLLHAQIWNPASCRYAFYAASSAKIPIITTEHDPFKISILKDLFKKSSLKKVSKIIAISDENKKILRKLYPSHSKKIQIIKNGIDTVWWQSQLLRFSDEDRRKIKEELFEARENTLIVICIAELHERKGQKYLIEAVPEVIAKFQNVKFVFVGEGPARKDLEKLTKRLKIGNHVVFTGRQKGIPGLLKSSDIFVLPSRREAFGLVNLEAMLTPLPVVATRVGGIPEIVVNGKTGILVEAESAEALAQALIKLIRNPKLREKMAEAGKKRVLCEFDAKKMAEEYEKVYEKIQSRPC